MDRLESLLAFDVGTVVAMEGKGVGRVVDANLGLESFKVDFERHKGLTVGFKAAPKLLRPLARTTCCAASSRSRTTLKALPPPELLRVILQSYDRPLTAGEIRDILAGIVTESQWTSWWAAARKHPQVVASGGGARQTYRWADTSGDALDSVWKASQKADPRKQDRAACAARARATPSLRDRMAEDLVDGRRGGDGHAIPGLAFEIWFALERTGGAPEDVDWTPDELLADQPTARRSPASRTACCASGPTP